MRCALAVAFCLLALIAVAAQQPQQPTFRAGIDVVAVDVHAVDGSGRPVPDLKPDDFTITVDGKPRTIVTADYVSHAAVAGVGAAPAADKPVLLFSSNTGARPAAASRTILLVVDEENIRAGSARNAARAAEQFLERLQPADRVGFISIPRTTASIDPTTDRARIKEALAHVSGHLVSVNTQLDTIYALGVAEAFAKRNETPQKWEAIKGRECSRRSAPPGCPQELDTYAEAMMTDARQRAHNATDTLVTLMDALAQLPGTKTLVYIAEELPVSDYLAERQEFNSLVTPLAAGAARARASFYVLQLDRPMSDVEDRYANPTAERDADMRAFGLETVTSLTGGRRMLVSGKPEGVFERLSLELSGYYLLGFRSETADRDGKPHAIKVSVTRKGIDVRARQMFSYAADTASTGKNATDFVNRLLRAPDTQAGIPMSVATYSFVEPASGTPQMRVLITAEIDRGATKEASLTVGYSLTDAAGKNAGANVEQVTLKPAIGHPDGPLVYIAAALVPPGSYSVRVAAADAALRAGSVVHGFEARPTDAGGAKLSELVVLDPYVAEANKPRPSVSAAAVGQLTCYLEAYSGDQPNKLTGRLELGENADSAPRASAPLDVAPPDSAGRVRLTGVLPVDDVPPGDYVARAVVLSNGTPVGHVERPVHVTRGATAAGAGPTQPVANVQLPPAQPSVAPPSSQRAAAEAPVKAVRYTAPAATVGELMARVAGYISDYAEQMSLVIGIEHYGQWLQREDYGSAASAVSSPSASRAISRQLVAEFALVRIGTDWDGFRNVYEVDGKPVPEAKDRMVKLFTEAPGTAVAQSRKLAAESSRYNLGSMQRNFNVPTVALFFLSAANQGRFRFTKDKDDEVGGVKVWKVKYQETQKPTIIRTSSGKDMPVKGEAWIDPIDGRVLKTHMQIDSEMGASTASKSNIGEKIKTTASITATYALEPKLGILVPSEMLETYEAPMRSQFTGDDNMTKVNCRATYTDFKRFETSGRLVTPK